MLTSCNLKVNELLETKIITGATVIICVFIVSQLSFLMYFFELPIRLTLSLSAPRQYEESLGKK